MIILRKNIKTEKQLVLKTFKMLSKKYLKNKNMMKFMNHIKDIEKEELLHVMLSLLNNNINLLKLLNL